MGLREAAGFAAAFLAGSWVFAAALIAAARLVWRRGIRRYSGASA